MFVYFLAGYCNTGYVKILILISVCFSGLSRLGIDILMGKYSKYDHWKVRIMGENVWMDRGGGAVGEVVSVFSGFRVLSLCVLGWQFHS
ncbi:hypothetical protein DMA11_12235 [Marinilabiliaceae bacterium JC017]|nr:hypothetical protein DMA11_12235 [Marinilabiliaceae bacterium JC017]